MRRLVIALALALGACSREPDFDDRFQQANARISEAAQDIDAQVSGTPEPGDAATR